MEKYSQKKQGWLARTSYPGRGIIMGQTSDGTRMVQIYWIMGRSNSSQNRLIRDDDYGSATVVVANSAEDTGDGNADLIFYKAMGVASVPGPKRSFTHVVSNGDQTESIVSGLSSGDSFATVFSRHDVEPDGPHFTSRIAGIIAMDDNDGYELAIIKISATDYRQVSFQHFKYRTACAGWGHCITTYEDNGSPLPPFQGEPFSYPLSGTGRQVVRDVWEVLNKEYRVAAIAKFVDRKTGNMTIEVINRNDGKHTATGFSS